MCVCVWVRKRRRRREWGERGWGVTLTLWIIVEVLCFCTVDHVWPLWSRSGHATKRRGCQPPPPLVTTKIIGWRLTLLLLPRCALVVVHFKTKNWKVQLCRKRTLKSLEEWYKITSKSQEICSKDFLLTFFIFFIQFWTNNFSYI